MNPLVSILIASRYRFDRLCKTINSINETTSENIEFLIRIDDDDEESLSQKHKLEKDPRIKFLVGPRYQGYTSHADFMNELLEISSGKWCFFFDDDTIIIGKGWDKQLATVPTEGCIVHPEFYWLGQSKYGSGSCEPVAICVPNRCWEQYGVKLEHAVDDKLQKLLVKNGWKNHWLKGIIAHHLRDDEATLSLHREI